MRKIEKYKFYLFFLTALFFACNNGQFKQKPANLIPFNNMVEILSETYLIESMIYFLPPDSDRVLMAQSIYSELFIKHSISKEQFVNSIRYYLQDKKRADELLTEVSNLVEKRKDEFCEQNEIVIKRDDEFFRNKKNETVY